MPNTHQRRKTDYMGNNPKFDIFGNNKGVRPLTAKSHYKVVLFPINI